MMSPQLDQKAAKVESTSKDAFTVGEAFPLSRGHDAASPERRLPDAERRTATELGDADQVGQPPVTPKQSTDLSK